MSWERTCVDAAVIDAFGYYAFQMGMTRQPYLAANRMPYRRVAALADGQGLAPADAQGAHLVLDPHFLPFQSNHLDLLVYPHALERCVHPQQAVREAERVLVPDGRLVISGLNPYGLKALGKRVWRGFRREPGRLEQASRLKGARPIAIWRLKEWLHLLGFEIESVQIGSKVQSALWGDAWWGAGYVVVAIKKVPGMRLLTAPWQQRLALPTRVGQAARSPAEPSLTIHPQANHQNKNRGS